MAKFKNKVVASFLVGTMLLGSVSGAVASQGTKVVYAESQALKDARAKVNHLIKSMQTNYLGIKNQATWEQYKQEAIVLLDKIPKSEAVYAGELSDDLIVCEYLLSTLASVNQVEKSIQPKSEGGYGNHHGIKNAETWRDYLKKSDFYFYEMGYYSEENMEDWTFKKQYDELFARRNKVEQIVKGIEDKFQVEYDAVVKLFNEAKSANDKEKGKVALTEAEKLGTCSRSDNLERDIKSFFQIEGESSQTDSSKKSEYIKKLSKVNTEVNNIIVDGSTVEMREALSKQYSKWDDLLNDIYGVLKTQLSSGDMEALKKEQLAWIKTRDNKADKAFSDAGGGTLAGLEYTSSLIETTKNRCYELVEKYMK